MQVPDHPIARSPDGNRQSRGDIGDINDERNYQLSSDSCDCAPKIDHAHAQQAVEWIRVKAFKRNRYQIPRPNRFFSIVDQRRCPGFESASFSGLE